MALAGKIVLITGASMGIGASVAQRLAQEGPTLVLFARSEEKLAALAEQIRSASPAANVLYAAVDIRQHASLASATENMVKKLGRPIDVLINNAGLAVGAPKLFSDQTIDEITTMVDTNISGTMFATHAALNQGQMMQNKRGTILNITSVTGLEVPPFPGEAVYHSSKAAQEAFTNVLRTELQDTNIKVLAVRPGVVATNFHEQRVGYDREQYNQFIAGYEPLIAEDVAEAVSFVLKTPERVSVKAIDVVPTPQRSLQVFDKNWNERNGL